MAPWGSRGAALLSSTGDRLFVMDMRYTAQRLGMYLDDFGLWRWTETNPDDGTSPTPSSPLISNPSPLSPDIKAKGHWVLVAGETEESIFEELNRPFVEPPKRNFGFLNDNTGMPRLRDVVNTRKGRPKTTELVPVPERRKLGRPKSVALAASREEAERLRQKSLEPSSTPLGRPRTGIQIPTVPS